MATAKPTPQQGGSSTPAPQQQQGQTQPQPQAGQTIFRDWASI